MDELQRLVRDRLGEGVVPAPCVGMRAHALEALSTPSVEGTRHTWKTAPSRPMVGVRPATRCQPCSSSTGAISDIAA